MTLRQDLTNPTRDALLTALGIDPKLLSILESQHAGASLLPSTSLQAVLEEYIRAHLPASGTTRTTYRYVFSCFETFLNEAEPEFTGTPLPLNRITPEHVRRFVTRERRDGLRRGSRSMNRDLSILSSLFIYAVKHGYLHRNPATLVERAHDSISAPKALGEPEQRQLLDMSRRTTNALRNYTIIHLTLNTGLRAQEVCNLRWANVDFAAGYLHVVQGKGGKDRTVPLLPDVAETLTYYRRCFWKGQVASPGYEDTIFLNTKGPHWGRAMRVSGLDLMMDPLLRNLGKPKGCSFHILRHTFAVNLLWKGVHIAVIAALLGHTSFETTNKYLLLGDPAVNRALSESTPEGAIVPGIRSVIGRNRLSAIVETVFQEDE